MSDGELGRLRHAFEADARDEAAARRYTSALFRLGKRDEATELFRFKFLCDRSWADLAPTASGQVKFCDGCQKSVFAVSDEHELRDRVRLGQCVAMPASRVEPAFEQLAADPKLHAARSDADACVVAERALGVQGAAADLARALPWFAAERLAVAPLAVEGDRLHVASARPERVSLPELERATTGWRVVLRLATEEEVQQASRRVYGANPGAGRLMGAVAMPNPARVHRERVREEIAQMLVREEWVAAERAASGLVLEAAEERESLALRGQARAGRRDHAGALEDLGKIVDTNHALASWRMHRARSRFCSADFEGAVNDYSRILDAPGHELLVRDNIAHILASRGRARALAGDRAGAREDLLAALRARPTDGYHALWLAVLLEDASHLAAYDDRPGWFARLAAFGLGALAAEALIDEARGGGDQRTRRERSCEAHAFVALDLERRGDRGAARRHYEACLAANMTTFVEDEWAQARLARAAR